MTDLLIENGLIIDGSGGPGYYAAVSVRDERIAIHRGEVPQLDAARTIDAAGKVVCPGFVDLHSHAGLTILGEPHHDPKVRQGVTTELIGIDGISHSPFKSHDELRRYIWLDSGLNGYPPEPADWLSVADQLDKYDDTVAINIAYILGNSSVRIWGVGWGAEPATDAQLEDMKAVVREAMEEGAWGLSTGLDYPPGAYASTEELAALANVSARMGGFYHTHTRASLRARGLLAALGRGAGDRAARRERGTPDALPPGRAGRGKPPRLPGSGSRTPATTAWTLRSTAIPTPTPAPRSPSCCRTGPRTAARNG